MAYKMAGRDYVRMQDYFDLSAVEFMNAFLLFRSADNDEAPGTGTM